jgi:hypothetical protein
MFSIRYIGQIVYLLHTHDTLETLTHVRAENKLHPIGPASVLSVHFWLQAPLYCHLLYIPHVISDSQHSNYKKSNEAPY